MADAALRCTSVLDCWSQADDRADAALKPLRRAQCEPSKAAGSRWRVGWQADCFRVSQQCRVQQDGEEGGHAGCRADQLWTAPAGILSSLVVIAWTDEYSLLDLLRDHRVIALRLRPA